MKIISNDLRSSCRSLLIGAYQERNGGKNYNSIFQDILNDSDIVGTIDIDGNYKMTLNVLVTDRWDIYGAQSTRYILADSISETSGYDVGFLWGHPIAVMFLVFWKGNEGLFAVYLKSNYMYNSYSYATMGTAPVWKHYCYPVDIYEYVKGSAVLTTELPDPESIWKFQFAALTGTSTQCLNYINSMNLTIQMTFLHKHYQATFSTKTDPETGKEVQDNTQPPTVELASTDEATLTLSSSGSINLYPSSYGWYYDVSNEALMNEWDDLINAICTKYGGETCFKHEKPTWLIPKE